MKLKDIVFKILLVAVHCLVLDNARAQVSNHKAYSLFLYNFSKYVQWPEGSVGAEFIIGVYGESPVLNELQKMARMKKAGDKSIRAIPFASASSVETLHILFIPADQSASLAAVKASLKEKPVLIVAEKPGLVDKGAAISFLVEENNLRFELNLNVIAEHRLKVAKALESLAHKRSPI